MEQEIDVFYNRYGKPILRLLNDGRLVGFNGHNYYFIDNDAVYNYQGQQVGWIGGGLIRDLSGNVFVFGERVTDNVKPFLPFKQFKPFASFVQFPPYKPYLPYKKLKPLPSFSWSNYKLTQDDE
ncbi:MAG: hypothetical protein PHQ95_00370 [Candidatus Gracilibacteria bacterium]|nr:hypothetical protein [Candidatus Gracilibacteria bacterium]